MPQFSAISAKRLATCHIDLQRIMNEVVKGFDISIVCGHRDRQAQTEAFNSTKSQLEWPNSKHNTYPSLAVDIAPYPIDWNDSGAFYLMAGYVIATADRLRSAGVITHSIRYGGDWNGNHKTKDQRFNDLPHFELT